MINWPSSEAHDAGIEIFHHINQEDRAQGLS